MPHPHLDAFLFEARAYLDLFMLYVLMIMKPDGLDPKMHMKKSAFVKMLGRVEAEPFKDKVGAIEESFKSHDIEWINLLTDVTH